MKARYRRLQRLEQRAETLAASRPEPLSGDDELLAWYRDGCVGPLPVAGPRPTKYRSEEAWQRRHRFWLSLSCRSVGRPDPPGMTEDERREVDETLALWDSAYATTKP